MAKLNFTEAYKRWKGEKWEWKKEDGSLNHPSLSEDPLIRGFYVGYTVTTKDTIRFAERLKDIETMQIKLKQLEKELKTFLQGR